MYSGLKLGECYMCQKNKKRFSAIYTSILITVFIMLATLSIIGALREKWNARSFAVPVESLTNFTYEIEGGENGNATFPYSFKNIDPHTAVTIHSEVEPGLYDSLLVKTVYTGLRLYADDILIYECGQAGSYPTYLLDPPTLLEIVPLPENATNLRFEYISPSQRSTMSLPVVMAGSDGELLADLFIKNSVILMLSLLFLLFGAVMVGYSLLFWNKGKVFINLGLFALAVGCWSFAECNATAFIVPYPVLLYYIAFGGFFTLIIPLLRYMLLILNPRNSMPMRLISIVVQVTVVVVFALQLMGKMALSKSLYLFHILVPLGVIVFAITTIWEHFRYHNKMSKQFVLPSLVLVIATLTELANYSFRFTHILSLFFLLGTFIFTLMLGIIGMKRVLEKQKETEKMLAEGKFYRRMSHNLLTPLSIVSTNVQIAKMLPEQAEELLTNSQAEIMKMADMIRSALDDSEVDNK